MLIYLNRTGYNGLFQPELARRLQRAGRPVSRRVTICDAPEPAGGCQQALRRPRLTLEVRRRFEEVARRRRGQGDFVYLDPPVCAAQPDGTVQVVYGVWIRQRRAGGAPAAGRGRASRPLGALGPAEQFVRARNPSSSTSDNRRREPSARPSRQEPSMARRAINSRASRRGAVREYLITNIRVN